MKVAVLSDTHGVLRPRVEAVIAECDGVIHAGDINSQSIIDRVLACRKEHAPVYFVRGNNDKEWARYLAKSHSFELEGVKIYLTHEKGNVPRELGDHQIIICGHSHKYSEEIKDGRLWLNPGACGNRRFGLAITMAVLYLEAGKWQVEKIEITP